MASFRGYSVSSVMKEWGLAHCIDKFKERNISFDLLLHVPVELIYDLLETIEDRMKFHNGRTDFLTKNPEIIQIDDNSLLESFIGRTLLLHDELEESDRSDICRIIVDHLLMKNLSISKEEFLFWAREIQCVFRHEYSDNYYVSASSQFNQRTKGKLYNKYTNLKKNINKNSNKENKKPEEITCENKQLLLQLESINPNDKRLNTLWEESYPIRTISSSIKNYYDKYPVLQSSVGINLLKIDFRLLNAAPQNIFLERWPILAPKILDIAIKKNSCPFLTDLKYDVDVNTLSILILPYLLKPTSIKITKTKKWKPSKHEISDGFICMKTNFSDFEPHLTERKANLESLGLTLQPIIIAVGVPQNIHSVYIVVNDVRYKLNNLLEAVNDCFQTFYALDAQYPFEAEIVWDFIQRYGFQIPAQKGHKTFTCVTSLGRLLTKSTSS